MLLFLRSDHINQIPMTPGFQMVDWIRLSDSISSKADLEIGKIRKVTLEELGSHCTEGSVWTAYEGNVYDITQFSKFHPGGVPKIMMGAGMDCTALYKKYHPWVNAESMLAKVFVGVLVSSESDDIENEDVLVERLNKVFRVGLNEESHKKRILKNALANLEMSDDEI